MNKNGMILNLIFLVGLLGLSGCLMTRDDIQEEEQKKVVQQQVSNLQRGNADAQSRYSELTEEIRDLNGKNEILENKFQQLEKERSKSSADSSQQLTETNKKVAALQEELQKLQNQVGFVNQEMLKMSQAQAAAASAPQATSEKPSKGDKKTDYYKLGEENFAKKDWRNAVLQYENYRKHSPKGKSFPSATFKIGLCFRELGMKDDAKTFFEEVVSSFPESSLAKQAKDQLKKK